MWQGFTIALREGIEAFLIVALTLSYLKRTGRARFASAVYAAIVVSVLVCVAAGFLLVRAGKQPLWEGILALVAAVLVGSFLIYMKRISSRLKTDIEVRLERRAATASDEKAFWGVFAFVVLMITREGMETALLVVTALFQMRSSAVAGGLVLGVGAAAAIGLLWTRIGKNVDVRALLNITAVFLAIFLVQLVLYGIHELAEARVFGVSQKFHDATEILGPDGKIGHLLAYSLAIVPTVWLLASWWKRRSESGSAAPHSNAA